LLELINIMWWNMVKTFRKRVRSYVWNMVRLGLKKKSC